MAQRILYGILGVLIVVTIVTVDVGVARAIMGSGHPDAVADADPNLPGIFDSIGGTPIGRLLSRGSTIPVVFAIVLVIAAFELNRLFACRSIRPQLPLAIIIIAVLFISPWLSAAEWLGRDPAQVEGLQWQVVWLLIGLVGSAILLVMRGRPEGVIRDIGATWFMMIYLGLLPSFAVQIRCDRDTPGVDGAWLLLVVLLVTKFADIGGYLTGSLFGRHKLAPSLSPGKTIEGAVGGTLASVGLAMAIAYMGTVGRQFDPESSSVLALASEIGLAFGHDLGPSAMSPLARSAIIGFTISVVGQFGDLFESALKRDAGMKDSGRVMPRFGGILDLIDSPVLTLPVAWWLLTVVWAVA